MTQKLKSLNSITTSQKYKKRQINKKITCLWDECTLLYKIDLFNKF